MKRDLIVIERLTIGSGALNRAIKRFADRKRELDAPARIGFLVDATGSRGRTWEEAQGIQGRLFRRVAGKRGIELRLVHYGGQSMTDHGWTRNPLAVAMTMSAVRCERGLTQIVPGLERFLHEGEGRPADAIIVVGDCFEERIEDATLMAARLKYAGIKAYPLLEGDDWVAETAFRTLAMGTGGKFARLGEELPLADMCEGIALLTAGGKKALARLPNKTVQRLLLPAPKEP